MTAEPFENNGVAAASIPRELRHAVAGALRF